MSLRNKNSKRWCFTINNPDETSDAQLAALQAQSSYLIYQKEEGENHTPHYQGYVEFPIRKRGTTVKNILPSSHLEVAAGSAESNKTYCSKEPRLAGPNRS